MTSVSASGKAYSCAALRTMALGSFSTPLDPDPIPRILIQLAVRPESDGSHGIAAKQTLLTPCSLDLS
jgi:hypothetical protein